MRGRLTFVAGLVMTLLCLAVLATALIGLRGLANQYNVDRIVRVTLKTIHMLKNDQIPSVLPSQGIAGVQVIRPDGSVESSSVLLQGKPRMAFFQPPDTTVRQDMVHCDSTLWPDQCMVIVAIRVYSPNGDYLIYAADPVVPWYVDPRVDLLLFLGAGLIVAVTTFGTYLLVGRALRPVDAISEELATITASDLDHRVPVPRNHDEIRRLAETANATLDRLEEAVEQQRRFASDASHDLRSPLTAMRAEVEGALLDVETADWEHTGEAILGSIDRLQALVDDLLQIARLDSGAPGRMDPVDLAHLAATEIDRRRRRVRIIRELQPGVIIMGDRLRLARVLTNLLDNAERHANSVVVVKVYEEAGCGVLEVLDDGAGVPHDKREHVFQRFTRLDAARSRDAGGTGLGLAIARQICEGHGGTLGIEDSVKGARFVLRIPVSR
ncbi:HAMP domain-containing histidine kinase [Herbidospora galbida]|uniref:histidine kinase n=1 Tax=Herbidospora galbida TaxID=2575442 RepID=A0A4U3MCY2_9ACTN|nr:HAMP domain-containing sensor histidine kinase [Herbidospora galbida]TKK85617.1 HAMP domain-containing histidine kinase [Herbidospora galbida]